jgi:hypothetical protein
VIFIHHGYFSVIQKNKTFSFAGKRMELETMKLCKVSHVQKDTGHIFSLTVEGRSKYKYWQAVCLFNLHIASFKCGSVGRH